MTILNDIGKVEQVFDALDTIQKYITGYSSYQFLKHRCLYLLQSLYNMSKFKAGDKVQLGLTPEISATQAPGWIGVKHLLVKGAKGTVKSVDHYNDMFRYDIEFDNETRHSNGEYIIPEEKGLYCFSEDYLERSNNGNISKEDIS